MRKINNLTDEQIERLITDSMGVKSLLGQPVKEKTLRLLKNMVSINSQKSSSGFPNPILIILSSGMILINVWVLMSFISSRISLVVISGQLLLIPLFLANTIMLPITCIAIVIRRKNEQI